MLNPKIQNWLGIRLVLLICLLAFVIGCQEQTPEGPIAAPPLNIAPIELTAGAIEPGTGIQEVKLGMGRAAVIEVLGEPSEEDHNEFKEGESFLLYHPLGIELSLSHDSVSQITLHAKDDLWTAYTGATSEGVGVTSTFDEVTAALGPADEEAARSLVYFDRGLWFRFEPERDDAEGSPLRAESVSIIAPQE